MKIRMLVGQAGIDFTRDPGTEHDLPEAEALRMIEAGIAAPVAPAKAERATATRPAAETRAAQNG